MNIIKKILFPFILLLAFSACKSNKDSQTRNIQLLRDTAAYNNSTLTDSSNFRKTNTVPVAKETHVTHSTSTHSPQSSTATSTSGSNSSTSTSTTQSTRKKGWSKAAQGAVIGGAAGAVGGAIISKHKGTGAAVGAAVGATGGYIIGRSKDKKDGR
ncbi:MAG: glycine zipper domain-containing protein [Ginsengibacter sp.]